MSGLVLDDLRNHARTFLFEHSLETLFYGNLTITTANKMADSIIVARRDFLQNYVKQFQNGKWKFIWEMLSLKNLRNSLKLRDTWEELSNKQTNNKQTNKQKQK